MACDYYYITQTNNYYSRCLLIIHNNIYLILHAVITDLTMTKTNNRYQLYTQEL